mmetsp:Transcript_8733/g.19973  ORF Transcript_8733/g.19973 Transcript_8733/m.19973 type:complete len:231 (+) Transcript_8733:108-800(+)
MAAKGGNHLDLATFDFNDAERRGQYFVEWRVTNPEVASNLSRLQATLKEIEPTVEILQSCAADNIHITMNELTLNSEDQVRQCLAVVQEFERTDFHEIVSATAAPINTVVGGLDDFDKRVLFTRVNAEGGNDILTRLFNALHKRLVAAGFAPKAGRPFQPHITVCKAPRGSKVIPAKVFEEVRARGLDTASLGQQPLDQLAFCVKRKKAEPTPPVLYTISAAATEGVAAA